MTKGTWRMGLLVAGTMLFAFVALVFRSPPESGEPGPSADRLQLHGEPGPGPGAGNTGEASKKPPASPSAPGLPAGPASLSGSGSPPGSSSAGLSRPSSPSAGSSEVSKEWAQERYSAALEEREAIRGGALQERRKLNVKERAAYWAVEARLIDEIGIDAYDELLYQDGRSNRSQVHWVAARSNAGQAGIQKGDVILEYGGEPVFAPRSVRETNRLLPPGGEIVVQVDRDGEILEFTMGTDARNRGRSGIVNGMTLLPFSVRP